MALTKQGPQNFQKSSRLGFRNMLCFPFKKTEEHISRIIPRSRMKFLSKTQSSFSNNEHLYKILVVLLKVLLVLFCALFPLLLCYFWYFKTSDDKQPLFEEDCNEALRFRFPTYEEFLNTTENVDSVRSDTSKETDLLEEHCSIPSSPDPDFNLHPREASEKFSPNGLDCTNDVRIDDSNVEDDDGFESIDEFNDSVEASKIEDAAEIESEEEDFIKALQIQIMKAKANAKVKSVLPSIPEEPEYPITKEDDLKPLKKEESFNHRDLTKELHRFHKQYTEKMRKYDTLNHQKTYAKELKTMQSKDSVESVLSRGICVCKPDKKTGGKTEENREIDGELELVYVVQLWVSWECIVWQYKKALEMYSREAYGSCRFNEVAVKFEHFQVMIQRFMENESFDKGSRVECYVRNRLARRKLLQVPLVKEDEVKDNENKGGTEEEEEDKENTVKLDGLVKILQESIRILWQFIRADKLVHISTLKCHLEAEQECTSPAHSKIQTQILLDLQKKERKLKKIIKRKKCMLKNCKEDLEDDPNDDELCFLTMVDLKLVSRMLNLQRITRNQLSWCHHKLSCITFSNGKIKIQPSSFLFPFS